MIFSDLKAADSALEFHSGNEALELLGYCSSETPKKNHLLLIKNKRFLTPLLERLHNSEWQDCAILIEKKFFEDSQTSLKNEWDKVLKTFSLILFSPNMGRAMALLSKPFYDLKFKDLNLFVDGRDNKSARIHPTAKIAPHVFIGENVIIGENVHLHAGVTVMSHAEISKDSVLFPNVTIYPNVKIGERCRIHSSSVIGADGFGYHFEKGEHLKIWHTGSVVIGHDVEIGAATTVDAGTFEPTIIKNGVKIDNQVQVAHNVFLGKHVIICGQAGTSGSAHVGDYSVLGGKAGVGPDVHIGSQCQIAGSAMVSGDCPDGSVLAGHPARALNEWLRGVAYLRKESLRRDVKK